MSELEKMAELLVYAGQIKEKLESKDRQIAALEAKVEQEHENFLAVHRDNMKAVDRIAELKAKLERARDWLDKYGRHSLGSPFRIACGMKCVCGLDEVRKELAS